MISIDDPIVIVLQNPIIMKVIQFITGSYIKVKPWIELSSEDIFL